MQRCEFCETPAEHDVTFVAREPFEWKLCERHYIASVRMRDHWDEDTRRRIAIEDHVQSASHREYLLANLGTFECMGGLEL